MPNDQEFTHLKERVAALEVQVAELVKSMEVVLEGLNRNCDSIDTIANAVADSFERQTAQMQREARGR